MVRFCPFCGAGQQAQALQPLAAGMPPGGSVSERAMPVGPDAPALAGAAFVRPGAPSVMPLPPSDGTPERATPVGPDAPPLVGRASVRPAALPGMPSSGSTPGQAMPGGPDAPPPLVGAASARPDARAEMLPPIVPTVRFATPPPATRIREKVARPRRLPSPAQRAARAMALRQLGLAALILGCGAVLWHHLTSGPHGTLTVRLSQPADGAVLVDGAEAGAAGKAIRVQPGRHVVGFAAQAWSTGAVTIRLRDGETRTITLSPVAHRASLSLDSVPAGARLSLDGRAIGRAPRTLSLPPGRYSIGAALPGYLAAEQPVTLGAGEQRTLPVALQPVPVRSLQLMAPVGSWSEPVMLRSGDRFTLQFRGRIRVRAGGAVVLLDGTAPAALGALDDRGLSFTAVGEQPVPLDLLVRTPG